MIKNQKKIKGNSLDRLLDKLNCKVDDLPHFGYYPTEKPDEYITYEAYTDLRDYETISLDQSILQDEVKPHVDEAWIDLDKTKIGYEISFNKYFYHHKPLRSLAEVSEEILSLEHENEGLIKNIPNLKK